MLNCEARFIKLKMYPQYSGQAQATMHNQGLHLI